MHMRTSSGFAIESQGSSGHELYFQSATTLLNASLHDHDDNVRKLALEFYNIHPRSYLWSHVDENIVIRCVINYCA